MEGTKRDELCKFIEDVIASEYAKHKRKSTARVYVYDTEIKIWFNSEKPYLGQKFWELYNNVSEMIAERLKAEGYEESKTGYQYDFMVCTYLKRLPEGKAE